MKQQSSTKKSVVCSLQSAVSPRAGFTLLELLTVMVIMFILMGMSTLALRGLVRGAGVSGAVSNVRSILTQARQQAIMNQQRTAVYFSQSGGVGTMQILVSYGRAASGGGGAVTPENELPWESGELKNVVVYNFRGGKGTFTGGYDANTGEYFTSGITWRAGDDIAFQLGAVRPLPDGMVFDDLPSPPVVVFHSDGSAPPGYSLTLNEKNARSGSQGFAVTVASATGWIEVEEPGDTP